jgi:murein DD-endopeptidase MepM/ murein hydrolase activator NlpD
MGIDGGTAGEMVRAFGDVFNVRHIRPGDGVRVIFEDEAPHALEFRRGPVEEYLVQRDGEAWVGGVREFEILTETVRIEGTLESSLSEAVHAVGEDPRLALAFADVLAWDVDFYLDPRKGDTFQLVVEKRSHEGRVIGYGEILAAEYRGEVTGLRRVFLYPNPETGHPEYYAQDGSSAQRTFLKTPLKFAYISSKFGGRIHPTLKYYKQHQGVDYAAATGTPVWAIGDGVVTMAGWNGACGNTVKLRHSNGLETIYCHFSRIAPGITVGKRVPQKQVIGYVGATGRATGPHLHFGVLRHGSFINPLNLKLPPADPLPQEVVPIFQEAIASYVDDLDGGYLASNQANSDEAEVAGP